MNFDFEVPCPLDDLTGVIDDREGLQTQKVHLEETNFFQRGHRILRGGLVIRLEKGRVFRQGDVRDDHAGGVSRGVTDQPLEGLRGLKELRDSGVGCLQFFKFRLALERLVDGDIQLHRNQFGEPVHFGIRKSHDTPHIADHGPGRHRAEGNNLSDAVCPVLLSHVINDLVPAFVAKIDIDIRKAHTLRIQEPLKKEPVENRVDVGNPQGIRHEAPGRGPSSRPHRNPTLSGVPNEIPDNEEVTREAHLVNEGEFIIKPLAILGRNLSPLPFLKMRKAELLQVAFPGLSRGRVEIRQMGLLKIKFQIAALGNLHGRSQGFRKLEKEKFHLFWRFEVILVALVTHSMGLVQGGAGPNANEGIVGRCIFLMDVMDIVGGNASEAKFAAERRIGLNHPPLGLQPLVGQFEKEIFFPK